MKNQNGITLIALVITIIVLLLLAGVTMSLVVGDNGILSQATKATSETIKAQAVEEVSMAWASIETEYYNAWVKNNEEKKAEYFKIENFNNKYLKKKGMILDLEYDPIGTSTLIYVSNKNTEITYDMEIDENGKVKVTDIKTEKQRTTESASTIQATEYGKIVTNYKEGGLIWEILYTDGNNIYLITRDGVSAGQTAISEIDSGKYTEGSTMLEDSNRFPAANTLMPMWMNSGYKNTNRSMRIALFMLDSIDVWNDRYKNDYAEYAIGSPTIELLYKVYNEIYKTNKQPSISSSGYDQNLTGIDFETVLNHGESYSLASPLSCQGNGSGYIQINQQSGSINNGANFVSTCRPVVCLKSSVTLMSNEIAEDGTIVSYIIK